MEALHALYSRTNLEDDDILTLVCPMLDKEAVRLLGELFRWSHVDATDIDLEKYALAKKLSEVDYHNFLFSQVLTDFHQSWFLSSGISWKEGLLYCQRTVIFMGF